MSKEAERSRRVLRRIGRPNYVSDERETKLLRMVETELRRLENLIEDYGGMVSHCTMYEGHIPGPRNQIRIYFEGDDAKELQERANAFVSALLQETTVAEIKSSLMTTRNITQPALRPPFSKQVSVVVYRDYPMESELHFLDDEKVLRHERSFSRSLYETDHLYRQEEYLHNLSIFTNLVRQLADPSYKVVRPKDQENARHRAILIKVSGGDEEIMDIKLEALMDILESAEITEAARDVIDLLDPRYVYVKDKDGCSQLSHILVMVYSDFVTKAELKWFHGKN